MRPIRWLRRSLTVVSVGAAGAAIVVTTRHLLETPQPLESTLPAEGRIDRKHGGNLYYNVAGEASARPLVLLHDFYSGASNYEYRHVFPRFAVNFRTFAPDWLGFGMSEHPHVAYTGEFYANMLAGFLRDEVRAPASVIATGRAANIAVRAAADNPDLFESLVLVSPYALAGIELEPTLRQTLARAAQRASLGLVPYAMLATRPILRRQQSWRTARADDPATREDTVQHLYASAHQFGGQHALLALLTGALDLPMQNSLALMEPPALIVSGADDPLHPREEMEDLAILSPHADLEVIPGAGAAVMEDQPAAFAEVVTRWLRGERGRHVLSDEALLPQLEPTRPEELPTPAPPELSSAPAMIIEEEIIELKAAAEPELMERPPSRAPSSEPPTTPTASPAPAPGTETPPAPRVVGDSSTPSAREDTVVRMAPVPPASEPATESIPTVPTRTPAESPANATEATSATNTTSSAPTPEGNTTASANPAANEPAVPPRTPPKTVPRANRGAPSQPRGDTPHPTPGRNPAGRGPRPPEQRTPNGEPPRGGARPNGNGHHNESRHAPGRDAGNGHSGGSRRPRDHRGGH